MCLVPKDEILFTEWYVKQDFTSDGKATAEVQLKPLFQKALQKQ
jgi:hypothetical protein